MNLTAQRSILRINVNCSNTQNTHPRTCETIMPCPTHSVAAFLDSVAHECDQSNFQQRTNIHPIYLIVVDRIPSCLPPSRDAPRSRAALFGCYFSHQSRRRVSGDVFSNTNITEYRVSLSSAYLKIRNLKSNILLSLQKKIVILMT